MTATRYVSLASILAAVTLPAVRLLTVAEPFAEGERMLTGFSLLTAALVVVRHRSNIARLIRGQESRIANSQGFAMLTRVLHVLALGLWFGSGVFFTFVVGLTLFHTFEGWAGERPDWLQLTDKLTLQQGRRLAGVAVAPMFPQYFAVQAGCGMVAFATAGAWVRSRPGRGNAVRLVLIGFALSLVAVGWSLVGVVEDLRVIRYSPDPETAASGELAFIRWHTISLFVNLAVLLLVGAALAMAARLPADPPAAPAKAD
jgi:glycerol-3-phosphate acyltransferase PlsY